MNTLVFVSVHFWFSPLFYLLTSVHYFHFDSEKCNFKSNTCFFWVSRLPLFLLVARLRSSVQRPEDHISAVCRRCSPVGLCFAALTGALRRVKQLRSSTCISTVCIFKNIFFFVGIFACVCVGTSSTRKRKEHLYRWCVGVWMGYAVLMAVILNKW